MLIASILFICAAIIIYLLLAYRRASVSHASLLAEITRLQANKVVEQRVIAADCNMIGTLSREALRPARPLLR